MKKVLVGSAVVLAIAVTSMVVNKYKSAQDRFADQTADNNIEMIHMPNSDAVLNSKKYKADISTSEPVNGGDGGVEKKVTEIENDILRLGIPNEIEGLGLTDLESLDEKITNYFAENEIIEAINNGIVEDADKERISMVLQKAADIRSRAIIIRTQNIREEINSVKREIASGELPMPKPMSEFEIAEIEDQARVEYEKLLEQEATRQQREDEELLKEEQMFN